MGNKYRLLGYIMAANFEVIGVLLLSWWLGSWLNEKYSSTINWLSVTYFCGLVIIVISWVRIFYNFYKDYKKNNSTEDE